MPNRIIKESITTSETIDNLTTDEECFFYRIMVNCDDYGRMDARATVLLSKCFPLRIETMKSKDIQKMLTSLVKNKLIFIYGENKYIQMVTWEKHQQIRAKRSKYPQPTEEEYNGLQLISDDCICPRNPIQSESNPNPNPNPNPNLNPIIDDVVESDKPKKQTIKDIVNEYSTNEELIESINGFVEMRKAKGKFEVRALKLIIKELEKLASGNDSLKIDILNQSVMCDWKGVFELKQTKLFGNQPKQFKTNNAVEDFFGGMYGTDNQQPNNGRKSESENNTTIDVSFSKCED